MSQIRDTDGSIVNGVALETAGAPVTTSNPLPVAVVSGGSSGSSGGAVTEANGANVALGSTTDAAATTTSTSGTVVSWLRGIFGSAASMLALFQARTFTDRSGTTSATVNTFTSPFAANAARGFARVTNTASNGSLYVYDKGAGTASTTNSIQLQLGQSYIWDTKVPSGAIQVAGSIASMAFEACEA